MKKTSRILIVSLLGLFLAQGCADDRMGMAVPSPDTKPTAGTIPSGDPFNPDEPPGPVDPTDQDDPWSNDPARLARLGQTPIVEIYYTEYTDKSLFPSVEEMRYYTHVNVGHGRFVNRKTGDGGIEIADPDLVRKFIAMKAEYPELKVKLMIGGWGKNADGFSMMARDAAKRKLFVDECVRICNEYGVDGFDIDWEYPTYAAKDGDYVNGASPDDYVNFVTMFKELRAALPDKILSYAASDSGKYTDNYGVLPYVDYINVMTYSMGNPPYHNAPLHRSTITKTRSCDEVIDDIFHGEQKVPYKMMNFGVAFYGHGDANNNKTNYYYPSSTDYSMLEDIFFKGKCQGRDVTGKNYRIWDDVAKVPYLADPLGKMYASYEDIESVNYKVEYLKSRDMLGAMVWEFRHDDAKGTLRHALRHAMDGNPDEPGRLERPEENMPEPFVAPVMGGYKRYDLSSVVELSGICLSKDKDFIWGVCDENGELYKIGFDGKATLHWQHSADMEGVTVDPDSGDLFIAIEGEQKVYRVYAPAYNTYKTIWYVQEAVDGSYGNSGLEGITWYKDGMLYIGAQTGANLWTYKEDGTKVSMVSLRKIASGIKEVADLCYDPDRDWLWVIDSTVFKIYLFSGDASELLAEYDISGVTKDNPESICVDHANSCVWIADDAQQSKLFKISFTGL